MKNAKELAQNLGRRARGRVESFRRPIEIHPGLSEFMAIEDLDQKRAIIEGVLRSRYATEVPNFPHEEVNRRIRLQLIASEIAEVQHGEAGQKRLTGEDYIHHPAAVAYLTANDLNIKIGNLHIATATAWTHDVIEDTDLTPAEFKQKFGNEFYSYEANQVTNGVILLSKNMFADHNRLRAEIDAIKSVTLGPHSIDQSTFLKWHANSLKSDRARNRGYWKDIIGKAPNWVKHIRVWDKCHNNITIPEEDRAKTPAETRRIARMQEESFPETRLIVMPLVFKIGGYASVKLHDALKKSMQKKRN